METLMNSCPATGESGSRTGASANSIGALRYLLAVLIILHHTNGLMGLHIPLLLEAGTVVSAFFALSGYFAWQSYSRSCSSWRFVRHRLCRLLPAYWAVVFLSALGFSLLSDLPLGDYFTSAGFWKYVGANGLLLNFLAPELPGVFSGHLLPVVNGSLWYVKLEVAFTLAVPCFAWVTDFLQTGIRHFCRRLTSGNRVCSESVILAGLWLLAACAVFAAQFLYNGVGQQLFRYLCHFLMFFSGLVCSYLGIGFRWRPAFPVICFFSLILLGIFVGWSAAVSQPFLSFLFSAVVIWSLILLCMSTGVGACFNRNNMTYSLYLCHFPLIQLAISLTSEIPAALLVSALLLIGGTPLLYYGVEKRK